MAVFRPQAWIKDWATDIDGRVEFDATETFLRLPLPEIRRFREHHYSSDALAEDLPARREHSGPFEVDASPQQWLRRQGLDIEVLTDSQLQRLRRDHRVPMPEYEIEYGLDIPAYGHCKVLANEAEEAVRIAQRLHADAMLIDEWEAAPDVGTENHRIVRVVKLATADGPCEPVVEDECIPLDVDHVQAEDLSIEELLSGSRDALMPTSRIDYKPPRSILSLFGRGGAFWELADLHQWPRSAELQAGWYACLVETALKSGLPFGLGLGAFAEDPELREACLRRAAAFGRRAEFRGTTLLVYPWEGA